MLVYRDSRLPGVPNASLRRRMAESLTRALDSGDDAAMSHRGDIGRRSAGRLADAIAQRRADLGLKQSEVAERMIAFGVPVSMQTISAWEYGRPRIASHQVVALAASLECTTTFLLGLTEKHDKWTPDASLEELATRVSRDGKVPHLRSAGQRGGPPLPVGASIQPPLVTAVSSSRDRTKPRD